MTGLPIATLTVGLAVASGFLLGLAAQLPAPARPLHVALAAAAAGLSVRLAPPSGAPAWASVLQITPTAVLLGLGLFGGVTVLRAKRKREAILASALLMFAAVVGIAFGLGEIDVGAVAVIAGLAALLLGGRVERRG